MAYPCLPTQISATVGLLLSAFSNVGIHNLFAEYNSALSAMAIAGGAGQPELVAQKVREIIESGTLKLRHPVGPDAEPFLGWRASLNDEAWVEWGAQSDADWLKAVKADFGMDLKLE